MKKKKSLGGVGKPYLNNVSLLKIIYFKKFSLEAFFPAICFVSRRLQKSLKHEEL